MPLIPQQPDAEAGARDTAVRTYRPQPATAAAQGAPVELGGRKDGTEPTRFGDWEKQGRCIDF